VGETQARLLLQIATKNRENSISSIHTKVLILLSEFAVGILELSLAVSLQTGTCAQPLRGWLLADGLTACLGEALGLMALRQAEAIVVSAELTDFLEPNRQDTAGLEGKFWVAAKASDAADGLLVMLFLLGSFWLYASDSSTCDETVRTWTGRVLALKFVAPLLACGKACSSRQKASD
ncbi:unnamed protein product, partial [Polarella glacialis]